MPKLVVESGSPEGAVYNLRSKNIFFAGRGDDVDIVIHDKGASRKHFTIERRNDSYYVRDLESLNGTCLNGTPIRSNLLKSGDRIQVGKTVFVFTGEDKKDALVGREIGGYLIKECVGSGGMGTVYMANQLSMDRIVALKILSGRLVSRGDFVDKFINEARAAGNLNHPNIVQVHDVGKADDIYYYSMEFMKRGSVQDMLLQRKKISFEEAIPMILNAARGLEYAESKKVIHRDIKPDNLMLSANNTVKICDLGLAEVLSDDQQKSKREIVGSPPYMSPEQAAGKPLDHRSDIYSLGATFYRMLSGQLPFSGKTQPEIIKKRLTEEPVPLKEFGVPRAIVQIVEKMMKKNCDDRYPNAGALIADLEKIKSMAHPIVLDREKVSKHRFRSSRRKKKIPFIAGGVVLVFVAFIVYLLFYVFVLHPGTTITVDSAGSGIVVTTPAEAPSEDERGTPSLDTGTDRVAEAQAALSNADEHRRSHPRDWDNILTGYREIISRFPGTEPASLAERTAAEVEGEKENRFVAAKKAFIEAVDKSKNTPRDRYDEKAKLFLSVSDKYPDTEWGKGGRARAERIYNDARYRYKRIVRNAEEHIAAGRPQRAIDLYRTVVENYGIQDIVSNAENRMEGISDQPEVGKSVQSAVAALLKAEESMQTRAFDSALAELRNINLEGLPEDLQNKILWKREDAELLNALKQKLIAAVNAKTFERRILNIEKGLRGSLIRADEDSITIKTSGGGTIKSWKELDVGFICDMAFRCNLVPGDHLALGVLYLEDGRAALAIEQFKKAAKDKSLKSTCDRRINRARNMMQEKK